MPRTEAPNWRPNTVPNTRRPTRAGRPRRIQIESLYLAKEPEATRHARALIKHIASECPHVVGSYIPQKELERVYGEMCRAEGWNARRWTSIGRELALLTDRKRPKRNGVRFVAYRIPRR